MGSTDHTPTVNMKTIIFAALLAVAACRPQDDIDIFVVREESDPINGFNFRHVYELDNGVSQSVVGNSDSAGAAVISGSYSVPLAEGGVGTVTYTADALGYRAQSPVLPVSPVNPHPVPAHVQEMINFVNAQLQAGLVWNQQAEAWV